MQSIPRFHLDHRLRQAQQLIQAGRAKDAVEPIMAALAEDPQNTDALRILGYVQIRLDNLPEALRVLHETIGLDPEDADAHHLVALAHLHTQPKDLQAAERHTAEALRIDPNGVAHYGMMAQIFVPQERWEDVLTWAQRGLALDPQDTDCQNLRAHALTNLGRFDEARGAMRETLRQAPQDSQSHANQGWSLLHQNNPKQALDHFKESLRLEPGNEWAKAGLVEALKAKNPIYRVMLAFFLWMLRLPARARLGIVFGGVIGYNVLRTVAKSTPALEPLVLPLTVVWMAFIALTWTAMPLFNLLLRLSPSGRHALSDRQRVGSNLFAATVVYALSFPAVSLGVWLTNADPAWLERTKDYGLLFGMVLLPASSLPDRIGHPGFKLRAGVMAGIMAAGTVSFGLNLAGNPIGDSIFGLTLLANIATIWWFGLSGMQTAER